jgi:hypothetical protein
MGSLQQPLQLGTGLCFGSLEFMSHDGGYNMVLLVAEPPELFQLKCPSRTLKVSNTLKQE